MTYLEGNVGSFRPRGSDCAVNILRWVLVTVLTQVEDQAEDEELGTTRARRRRRLAWIRRRRTFTVASLFV